MIKHWKTTLKIFYSLAKSDWSEWSEITVDELYEKTNSHSPPLLIDIRSPKEFQERYGHIPKAISIPVLDLKSNFDELASFKEREIVTMCPGGGLSLVAVDILTKAGFRDVKSLRGGTDLWHQKGYPMTLETKHDKIAETPSPQPIPEIQNNTQHKPIQVHTTLDARGLSCPMPILKSRIAIRDLEKNQVLEILTTDPGSIDNIPKWAIAIGQKLIASEKLGPEDYRFLVKRLK